MHLGGRGRMSASALALALALASAWWSATTSMILLHDDARFAGSLSAALDDPSVRAELDGWVGTAIEHTSTLSSEDLADNLAVQTLRAAIRSDREIGPMARALTAVVVTARDSAVDQLDRRLVPKQPVRIDLAPLLVAAGVTVDATTAKELGLKLRKGSIGTELFTAEQLQTYQWRYDLTRLTRDFAGWVALLLLATAVATSQRPFVTLAVAFGLGALVALVAPPVITRLASWVGSHELGRLLQPLVVSTGEAIRPYVVWVAVTGAVGLAGCVAAHVVLTRRRVGAAQAGIEAEPA